MNKKPVCVCVLHSDKNKKHKVCLTNFQILFVYYLRRNYLSEKD